MTMDVHPREYSPCPDCAFENVGWSQHRTLPQVGQTYVCSACGHEVYVYDAGDPGETARQFRPVTTSMVRNLLFYDTVGAWPRSVFDGPLQEFPEHISIDYWMVEREDWSQSEWARQIGVNQQAVSQNVRKARDHLDD